MTLGYQKRRVLLQDCHGTEKLRFQHVTSYGVRLDFGPRNVGLLLGVRDTLLTPMAGYRASSPSEPHAKSQVSSQASQDPATQIVYRPDSPDEIRGEILSVKGFFDETNMSYCGDLPDGGDGL
jgi:hypothetical protein